MKHRTHSRSPIQAQSRGTHPIAWFLLVVLCLVVIGGPALFHFVGVESGYIVIPKRNVGYADTFTDLDAIVSRYNNQRPFRQTDPVIEYLVNELEQRGILTSRKRTWKEVGDSIRNSMPDQ